MLKFYKTIVFQRIATFEEATKVRVTGFYTELDENFQASYFRDFFQVIYNQIVPCLVKT